MKTKLKHFDRKSFLFLKQLLFFDLFISNLDHFRPFSTSYSQNNPFSHEDETKKASFQAKSDKNTVSSIVVIKYFVAESLISS